MDAVLDTQPLAMSFFGAVALFLYDILLTLEDEIRFVWQQPWSLPKSLYLVARYLGLATCIANAYAASADHLNTFCDPFNAVFMLLVCGVSISSDALLWLRVSALYGPAGRIIYLGFFSVARFLAVMFTGLVLYELAVVIWIFQASVNYQPDADNFGCFSVVGVPPQYLSGVFIAILIFNTFLLIVTLLRIAPAWWRGDAGALSALLIRDGMIYFVQIIVTSTSSAVFLIGANIPLDLQAAAVPWYSVLTPIAICRLFLNLKGMGITESGSGMTISESGLSIDFSLGSSGRRRVFRRSESEEHELGIVVVK